MSAIRGRRASSAPAGRPPSTTAAAVAGTGTQTPGPANNLSGAASLRIPRAHGMVGVGVGPNQPVSFAVGGGGPVHPLLDLSSIMTWRLIFAVAAAAYITGFHLTLPGGLRVGLPRLK